MFTLTSKRSLARNLTFLHDWARSLRPVNAINAPLRLHGVVGISSDRLWSETKQSSCERLRLLEVLAGTYVAAIESLYSPRHRWFASQKSFTLDSAAHTSARVHSVQLPLAVSLKQLHSIDPLLRRAILARWSVPVDVLRMQNALIRASEACNRWWSRRIGAEPCS